MTTRPDLDRPNPAEPTAPTLRARSPGDLVQIVPYLLGFHPTQSLVLVGLSQACVVVTARLDLTDVADDAAAPDVVVYDTIAAMYRGGAAEFVGVVFDERAEVADARVAHAPLPWFGIAGRVADATQAVGAAVQDVLLVAAGRLWSYTCADPWCCPPEGRPVGATSPVAAAATYAGLVALPDRAALAALLDLLPAAERERLLPAVAAAKNEGVQAVLDGCSARRDRAVKRALFAAARECGPGERPAPPLPDDEVARFGAALSGRRLRDAAWLAVDDGRLDGRPLWRQLARSLPDPYAAAPLFLFGWASWRAGDGALAGIAAERTLASDPSYSSAGLLTAALSHGLDPRRMPRLRLRRSA